MNNGTQSVPSTPPDFTNEYDREALPSLKECVTAHGNTHRPINVEIDGSPTTLNPGDVVEVQERYGTRLYFIRGRSGVLICQELSNDHHYLFTEANFTQMLDASQVIVHRDPWDLK